MRPQGPALISLIMLVAANLVPLFGVLYLGWSVFDVLLLFWMENIVIGVFNVMRLGTRLVKMDEPEILLLIPFFAFHYGLFTAAHGVFVMSLFGPKDIAGMVDGSASLTGAFTTLAKLLATDLGYAWALLGLVLSHGVSFVINFLGRGEYRQVSANQLMHGPYPRIVVLHCTIILGGMMVQALGAPVYAVIILVLVKIIVDAIAHLRERVLLRPATSPPSISTSLHRRGE
ncbi:hypothetical protein MCEMSEM23_01772 [Rhabdaerophilaceae bacterium]